MKACVLLTVLLLVQVYGAPVDQDTLQPGSCEDGSALGAVKLAISKINQDRTEGYKFKLHRLSNVHTKMHGESGVVFYLTLDIVETDCSVLIKSDNNSCYQARPDQDTPVYGQCKAVIYISKIHRVVRLYRYNCAIRPVPAVKVADQCPDCPTMIAKNDDNVQKTVSMALEKYNNESGLVHRFSVLRISRATAGMASKMYYNVEFMIQETTCTQAAAATDNCPPLECEFAHKGFCKSSLYYLPEDKMDLSVHCSIYEPEIADREKKHHLLGGETDHSHNDSHAHSNAHDQPHAADQAHTHDHVHDHTKSHTHHDQTHQHAVDSDHHHTHDHAGTGTHRHAHDHSHDHGHGHDHVHTHHAKAHDHSGDAPHQHHDYKHTDDTHTHEHDHELALDHDHKHAHLHEHEHHHHHHDHDHETAAHDHPEGMVRELPSMDQPTTLPAFPDVPAAAGPDGGVTLNLKPDPQIPGVTEPTIEASPTKLSAECPAPAKPPVTLVEKAFAEDAMFKMAA